MKRDAFTLPLAFPGELIIDNFAGGGGTSTGLEAAFGRPVDIAINHDPEALAMHAANHPHTLHLCESVWDVNPIQVTGNQPVALVWLSPDCKHFSKAKGGTPVSKHIRGLAWVGMRWVAMCKPRVLMLENVEEFQTWGPILVGPDGQARPDPARRGKTFQSFVRQLKAHGYQVDWRELRASDHGTPTIRKRLFLVARRDGLPIVWPEQTHAEPTDRRVIAGKLAAHRTAAECIDFDLHAESVFGRKRPLVDNTMRRVAKGLWKHVLTSASPYLVGAGGPVYAGRPAATDRPIGTVTTQNHRAVAQPVMAPYLNEHANASNQRTMPADAPLRTICAQVKGGHFSVVAPTLAPLRGTSEQHLVGHAVEAPLSTVAASGTHHALVGANLVTIGYGEREGQQPRTQDIEAPLGTVVAGGIKSALVAAHLVDMGHGEGPAGGKRFSHGIRSLEVPLNTVTASGGTSALAAVHLTHLTHHGERTGNDPREPLRTVTGANRGEQAMVAACLEQANGGFYDGDGRSAADPMSTVTSSGTQQRLITAYLVKYYSEGGQDSACSEPMHTVPTKARMGLVQTCQVPAATLAPEHAERARLCAELLHKHLPEHFPDPAELVLMWHAGQWWVLVDITLRMLKPRELFRAQGFPRDYHFERVPDPALLFRGGKQAADPRDVPLIDLSTTAQVRMCGNSVCPPLAEALARANFAHEALIYGVAA
ncbi:DNA cytosine methyltransferase [Delftia sp. DLF01]|uniref:DNA cytosine methyltransferase n=1 Tax=Delftia sp. DLF01 TaxID=2769279 RepID=UPI001784C1FB|nr:DNA cytosine methyltransferase [Delftia sp. DLF01]MBD9583008.1 DNA cytosine methyltransferase [Delftia sp. DLF01]